MKSLNDVKIGIRLSVGFGFVVALLTVVSLIAYWQLNSLNQEISQIVNEEYPKTELAHNMADNANVIARAIRNLLLVKHEEMQTEKDRIPVAQKAISEDFDKLEKLMQSDEGKNKLGLSLATEKNYLLDLDKFFTIQADGRRDDAVEFMVTTLRKSQGAYLTSLKELVEFQSEQMKVVLK